MRVDIVAVDLVRGRILRHLKLELHLRRSGRHASRDIAHLGVNGVGCTVGTMELVMG